MVKKRPFALFPWKQNLNFLSAQERNSKYIFATKTPNSLNSELIDLSEVMFDMVPKIINEKYMDHLP